MAVIHVEVSGLRNLASVSCSPSPALNLLYGANGSGKTSLLEALHLLGVARSFRTSNSRKLIRSGCSAATVFGRVDSSFAVYTLGVKKSISEGTLIRVNGERKDSTSALAELLPLQLITPESHSLLQGEPRERRSYVDWGLFHVEQRFHEIWKRYRRFLEQRNAGLRMGASSTEMQHWERGLAENGELVASMRQAYLQNITPRFAHLYSLMLDAEPPRISHRRGWPKDLMLQVALDRNRSSEQAAGFTMAGPHRGDFRLLLANGQDVADMLSRGQQKLAVCALRIAQMQYLQEMTGRRCTLLLDDLPAELDVEKRDLLMRAVADSGAQCFVTATDRELIDLSPWDSFSMFHVEHGAVVEVV
jgi:DNA replication and repair protein RecF